MCGYEIVGELAYTRIEVLSRDLEPIKAIKPGTLGICWASIAFDEEGNAYVGGHRIVKLSKHGDILRTSQIGATALLYIENLIHAFRTEEVEGTHNFKHVAYILDEDLNVIHRVVLDDNVSVSASTISRKAVFDGRNIFISGSHGERNDKIWTIYSLSTHVTRIVTVTTTVEVTKIETITKTHTITEVRRENITLLPTILTVTEITTVKELEKETITITEFVTIKELNLLYTAATALIAAALAGTVLWLALRRRRSL